MHRLDAAMRRDFMAAGVEVKYRNGQHIHRRGDADRALALVLEGQVNICRLDSDGQLVTAALIGEGASFGEIPLLTGRRRTHDAVAVGTVRLLRISPVRFRELLQKQPGLRDQMMVELAGMLAEALDMLDSSQRFNVTQRVARFLAARATGTARQQVVAVRQSDIATALGVTREAVAKSLRELRSAQLLKTAYRQIIVTDLTGIRMLAQDQ